MIQQNELFFAQEQSELDKWFLCSMKENQKIYLTTIQTVDETIDVEEFQIPPMLLQPYIENAVWHGLRYKTEKGQLNINIHSKSKDEIAIIITDDGIGRERSKALKTLNQKKQNSKGMNNITKRVAILNEMYKDKVHVTIEDYQDDEDTGTKVVVTLKKD